MYAQTIALALFAILVLLLLYRTPKENFDTYRNHAYGVQEVLGGEISLDSAELWSKYNWNAKDCSGYAVYDKYYDTQIIQNAYSPESYSRDGRFILLDNGNMYSTYKHIAAPDHNYTGYMDTVLMSTQEQTGY